MRATVITYWIGREPVHMTHGLLADTFLRITFIFFEHEFQMQILRKNNNHIKYYNDR